MKISVGTYVLVAAGSAGTAKGDVVLSEKIMKLSKDAAKLSAMAYDAEPNSTSFDELVNYIDEPDQALFAKKHGYCWGVFRGTTMTMVDWNQNFDPRSETICTAEEPTVCCKTRQGFFDGYYATFREDLEEAVRNCAKTCSDENECVVFTGHSQGGALAALAAVHMADLNPRVITFGEPPTIDSPCPAITSSRWIRYVNTKDSTYGTVGVTYDPVPFAPGFGVDQFGNFIILGGDPTGVAYIGLDSNDQFSPLNVDGFEAHSMVGTEEFPGYYDRIKALIKTASGNYPIRINGFHSPEFCTKDVECESRKCEKETVWSYSQCVSDECDSDDDCDSERCDSGVCMPKLGTCMACDEDSDCNAGKCILFKCANSEGLMDDECVCKFDSDCASGRCEGIAPPTCRATLGEGAHCNENSDCTSGKCSWHFRCEAETSTTKSAIKVSSPDEETETGGSKVLIITLSTIAGVVVLILLGIAGNWFMSKRREGYEEVGTTMDV